MKFIKENRFGYIHPISLIMDLVLVNLFAYYLPILFRYPLLFHSYITIAWIVIAFMVKFYLIYRYTRVTHILKLLFRQFFFFSLIVYAFIGFFKQPNMSRLVLAQYILFVFIAVFILKFISYYLLMKYREKVKGNIRNVVIIGENRKTKQLINVFSDKAEYGYAFKKDFNPNSEHFSIIDCFTCLLYTSPSPRDRTRSRMPSSA